MFFSFEQQRITDGAQKSNERVNSVAILLSQGPAREGMRYATKQRLQQATRSENVCVNHEQNQQITVVCKTQYLKDTGGTVQRAARTTATNGKHNNSACITQQNQILVSRGASPEPGQAPSQHSGQISRIGAMSGRVALTWASTIQEKRCMYSTICSLSSTPLPPPPLSTLSPPMREGPAYMLCLRVLRAKNKKYMGARHPDTPDTQDEGPEKTRAATSKTNNSATLHSFVVSVITSAGR